MADFISLPFYDLFAEDGHVPKIRESLPTLLTGVRRSILEIGAGTGLITTSLAEWTPAEIFALEPSAGMRGIEILSTDGEAYGARYLHRITEGGKVISEEEITGYAYRPPWNVLERELVTAGFIQTEGAEGLLA